MRERIERITKTLIALETLFPHSGVDFTNKDVAQNWVKELAKLSDEQLSTVFQESRKLERFPSLGQMLAFVKPKKDLNGEAALIADKIVHAIERYGWNNPRQARECIGEVGWALVENSGGWTAVTNVPSYEQLATYKAQWRNSVKAILNKVESGQISSAKDLLPEQERGGGLTSTKDILKLIVSNS